MDPVARRRVPGQRGRLGDLVFVVRKDVVDSTGVDLELGSQVSRRHRGAFDVPAREALSPAGRWPPQKAAFPGVLPEGEVGRVCLVVLDRSAMARAQLGKVVAREPAVFGKATHGVVHGPVG